MTKASMSELVKALRDLPPVKVTKYFVRIDGKQVEVSMQQKIEIIQHGECNYKLDGDQVVRRILPVNKTTHPLLSKAQVGYIFEQGDIHWPIGMADGGETWQIEYE